MKKIGLLNFLVLTLLLFQSCKENEQPQFTTYTLYQTGMTPSYGYAKITDLGGANIKIELKLKPFLDGMFPAHLHFGNINEVGDLAYKLNDVEGRSGESTTIIKNITLSDGSLLTYNSLKTMNGSIKVHLSDELLKHMVLAYGNIGANDNFIASGMTTCIGH